MSNCTSTTPCGDNCCPHTSRGQILGPVTFVLIVLGVCGGLAYWWRRQTRQDQLTSQISAKLTQINKPQSKSSSVSENSEPCPVMERPPLPFPTDDVSMSMAAGYPMGSHSSRAGCYESDYENVRLARPEEPKAAAGNCSASVGSEGDCMMCDAPEEEGSEGDYMMYNAPEQEGSEGNCIMCDAPEEEGSEGDYMMYNAPEEEGSEGDYMMYNAPEQEGSEGNCIMSDAPEEEKEDGIYANYQRDIKNGDASAAAEPSGLAVHRA